MIFRGQVDNNPMEILKVCLEQVLCLSSCSRQTAFKSFL